jgi:hypothetical protein
MAVGTWEQWEPVAEYMQHDPESLYLPEPSMYVNGKNLAPREEVERVRELYYLHMRERLGIQWDKAFAWERERSAFADAWVALCEKNLDSGLVMPGVATSATGRTPEQVRDHRVDAARTPQRSLKAGAILPTWQLLGIECVVCDREGLALPGGFYVSQQTLL